MQGKLLLTGLTTLLGIIAMGCVQTTDAPGAIAEESQVDDATADQATVASESYFVVTRRDMRRCAYPLCGGYYVAQVNQNKTLCADGAEAGECYVADLDVAVLGLAPEEENALTATTTVFRGVIVPRDDAERIGDLAVSAAWSAPTTGSTAGTFYRVDDNGLRCIVGPCPSLSQEQLNTSQSASIHEIDLSSAAGDELDRELASEALYSGAGLLIDGVHEIRENAGPAGAATVLRARQFFLPVQ